MDVFHKGNVKHKGLFVINMTITMNDQIITYMYR